MILDASEVAKNWATVGEIVLRGLWAIWLSLYCSLVAFAECYGTSLEQLSASYGDGSQLFLDC